MVMPHQIGVTIRAPVAAERVPELRQWLAEAAKKGLGEAPSCFAQCRRVHFARFYLLEETTDLAGRPIPASLVFMSEVDAPLRHHLAELADVAGEGMDQAFQHCTGYPGPGGRRRQRIAWLRRHRVRASAFYVNTVGRGVAQIRQEASLREALEDHLDRCDNTGRTATEVRRELQAFVAGRADLAWAAKPPTPPSLLFRARETLHKVTIPALLLLALPVLLPVILVWAVLLRLDERHDRPFTQRPTLRHLEEVGNYEDFGTQNPFAVAGFVRPGRLRQLTFRAVLFLTGYGVRHIFNRDSLAGVKTIHFARWVPLDGWRRMTFSSNYDGAVEAYNDDFINIIWWGLNATFSNGMDYPPTRWLFFGGAKLEEQFKNTIRCHQVAVPAWYAAYPELSADNIENNAQIRAGLRGEMSSAQAQQWLARL
jgi:hypothetical protein